MKLIQYFIPDQSKRTSNNPPRTYKICRNSINLLAVSDAKNRFTIVDIGAEGRQSDGGVFENSELPHLLETNALHISLPTRLNNTDLEFPYVLLGDEAFPLSTYMMRPYPRSGQLNISRKIFNYRLSQARRTVECAFGILVARWRLYRQPIIASTSTVVKAVQKEGIVTYEKKNVKFWLQVTDLDVQVIQILHESLQQ
ncbi:PREDICTED: uncharacterized protein LOC108761585 [Trachymyrmex cornetzi]|uniref:uncharacterized protein LOC108761585 n=1 Tax=Trachymyrmex cornetzi TaxID=471704 RepID=UPI00084F796D|nr:PREDICTED: uncharacterized protein LOC108761585 [Trachymyrmex cornetzi]